MIRHLLKLVWHRRAANLLLALEIFVSFLVVFPVAGLGLYYWRNARQPLGYDWRDVSVVTIDRGRREILEDAETFERLVRTAEAMPEVRTAAAVTVSPFHTGTDSRDRDGVYILVSRVTDGFLDAVDLKLVAGRWFGPEDDALDFEPVVIDRDLALTLWGDEDPIGRPFPVYIREEVEERVVGVVAEFKKDGELAGPGHFAFYRAPLSGDFQSSLLRQLVLEMEPGFTPADEERLIERLSAVSPGWTLDMKPLERQRATAFRMRLIPLLLGGTVALFLLSMVGLGLTGVLWQSITQRTRELGLRRAMGASRGSVRGQVLLEIALLTALAVGAGLLVVIQLPLFELVGIFDGLVFTGALVVAVTSIFGLTLLCGLYPSWLAMRVEPAEALRNE